MDYLRADWHVMTVTRGGHVSILSNLPFAAAKQAKAELLTMTPDGRFNAWFKRQGKTCGAYIQHYSDGDIVKVTILGPEGWSE